ncbi:16622_t:CDS:2, partial [Rhizophagus irregularis]
MPFYKCLHCPQNITRDEKEFKPAIQTDKPGLWDDEKQTEETLFSDDDFIMYYYEDEAEQMILDQNAESSAAVSKSKTISEAFSQETNEENKKFNIDSETDEEEINAGLTFPLFIDENDYRETTLDDAIKDKNHPLSTEWPSNIYRQFMEIVTEYQLPNSCGDRLIKLFNSIENVDKICFQNLPKRAKNSLITDNTTKNSKSFQRLQRQVFQRCLQILLSPIINKTNMYFVIKNEIYSFTPKISVILADMAEAGAFTMTYLPSTSKRPCYCCLVDNNDLNNMELSHITLRTPEIMKKIINENRAKDFLIHEEINYFWKSKDFNIYSATVLDRMHMLDLGITKYLLEYTREYLQQKVDSKTVNEIDHRLRKIPRYPGLIIFKNGLENITKFTANDYRNIMKVIIFIIDNLYDNYKEGGIMCKKLCNVFYKYLKMYMMLRQEMFTDMDLKELELHKIRKSSGFKNLLWEFKFTEIEEKVSQIIQDDTINPLHKTGFKNFRAGLEEFLTENDVTYDENFGYFKIYSNASVESMDIIRTSGSFYGSEWFSDVAVSSEKTEWYGKALLLFEFFAENKKDPINLILLQWYDEIYEEINMIAQQCGNQFLTKMDNRLGTITPYNNLRILSKGYQQGVKFTGAEMRDVMKIIVFVFDELYAIDN